MQHVHDLWHRGMRGLLILVISGIGVDSRVRMKIPRVEVLGGTKDVANWTTASSSSSKTSTLGQVVQTPMKVLGVTTKRGLSAHALSSRAVSRVLSTVCPPPDPKRAVIVRRRAAVVAVAFLAVASMAAACGNSQADPSPSTSPSAPTSSASTPPAWEANYDETQLSWYDEALQTWQDYDRRTAGIWAAGKATPEAMQLFEKYLVNPDRYYQQLRTLEASKITSKGTPKVLWTRAKSITSSKDTDKHGTVVKIEQCEDLEPVMSYQDGEPVKMLTPRDHPVILDVSVMRVGESWRIADHGVPQKAKECDPAMP